ncbi:spore germination protein GerW family protein [Georgenia satyanarayanai]|uniref:spore germination protein GerW family protein n=1 Tax=Georgenia satyanarayanai TaxID=860221 RepID=UPI001264BF36|nr:spore germination protein GerW family protein [Georgenia satyanarayanai]
MDETPANRPVETAGDALHVRRVFGEAYESGGSLVIPVAKVVGASGMGYGTGALGGTEQGGTGEGSGGGGGFAVHARPVGVYTVRDGVVRWHPALDLNRVILGGQVVGAIAVLALARALRARRR